MAEAHAVEDEALLDAATLALAEEAARAAGLTLEAWLERAIRRACAEDEPKAAVAPAEPERVSVLPRSRSVVIEQLPRRQRRLPRRALVVLGPLLLVLAGLFFLAMLPAGNSGHEAAAALTSASALIPPPTPAPPPAVTKTTPTPPEPEPSDPKALALWLEPRAASGNTLAQYRLGTAYALGKGVEKDYARAAQLLLSAAESGLAEAQYDYGVLCAHGLGVPADAKAAAEWYGKAAAQGHPEAALSLGYAYAKGIGVARSMGDAARWFRHAAERGVIDAQFNLAFLYDHGEGIEKSPTDAYAWYSIAAGQGDAAARAAAERVAKGLSPAQREAAKARVAELQQQIEDAH